MNDRHFVRKMFFKFFIPAVLSALALAFATLINSIFVGVRYGEVGLFILGAASPVTVLYNTVAMGIAGGGAIHFASALSQGRERDGNKIFYSVIFVNILLSIILAVIGIILAEPLVVLFGCTKDSPIYADMLLYVRLLFLVSPIISLQSPLQYFVHNDNAPRCASLGLISGGIVTAVVGYILIIPCDMGVNGAIWSTLAGALVMELVCLWHFLWGRGVLKLKNMTKPSFRDAGSALFTGSATAVQYGYQFVILLCFNRLLLGIGGIASVAIYDVICNLISVVLSFANAIILAMMPLVATFHTEHNRKGIASCLKISMITAVVSTAILSAMVFFSAEWYAAFTGMSHENVGAAANGYRVAMESMVLAAINLVMTAFFQNVGCEKKSYLIVALRWMVILLPAGILISLVGNPAIFGWCFIIAETVAVIIGGAMLWRYIKNMREEHKKTKVFTETFVGSREEISNVCERLQGFLENDGASTKRAYFVTLAVDETCRLIAENEELLTLQLTLVKEDRGYVLHIRDNAGSRFNPFEVRDDDEHGMGLRIVKKQATDFYYRRFVGYNTLTVVF